MYAKTLFLVDHDATVGGIAGGLTDLDALDARHVDVERLSVSPLSLPLERVADMSREHDASLVVVGVSASEALHENILTGRAALPDHPLMYLGVNAPAGSLLPARDRILRHVLVPSDFSVHSGCLTSCLVRVARRGTRIVTLMHVPDAGLPRGCSHKSAGELGRVDTDLVDRLKKMLFSAGVDEVRFIYPEGGSPGFERMDPGVSLVLVGATCNADIVSAYAEAASRMFARHDDVPALMLTAESCLAGARTLGAA